MPTIQDYVTPTQLNVSYLAEDGTVFDGDSYVIKSRESFIRHLLRIQNELSLEKQKDAFRNFADLLSWSIFYGEDKALTFKDEVHFITYIFKL